MKEFHRNYFSEIKTVKPAVRKSELQRRERVNYSVNSQADLEHQDASNPDPIRHDPSENRHEGVETSKKQAETPPRPLSELAIAIADVCKINPKIATAKQKRELNATYQALKSIGATPADVRLRETWWHTNDWRAKKEGRAPRPDELQAIWEEATAPVKKQSNGTRPPADLPLITAEHKPVISTDERRRIIEARMSK